MSVQADPSIGDAYYNDFYSRGGWKYSFWKEYRWHRRNIVKPFRLRRGMRMLEVACGNGFHTNLFCRMGFDCVGVDRSIKGIEWAKTHYPDRTFHRRDILGDLPNELRGFDVVIARGCSHYHYDLTTNLAVATTRRILQLLKPGGVFLMIIITNLSGSRDADKVWNNTLEDYRGHFASFGRDWSVDWREGMAICALWRGRPAPSIIPDIAMEADYSALQLAV